MTVIKLGWFKELPHGDHTGDSLRDRRGEIADAARGRIADYLDAGAVLAETTGAMTVDKLDGHDTPIGPLRTLTDGTMVWPSDLGYFVRRYGVGLGDRAVEQMASNDWQIPPLTPEQLDEVDDQLLGDD